MNINLVHPEESDIKYKISKFPDGQQTLDLLGVGHGMKVVSIRSRLNSFRDLELIICANQILRNLGANSVHLYVPYFLGGRSDRKFQDGGVHYLKQVITPIINSQGFTTVRVLDPHSDVLEACLNNFSKDNNYGLLGFALPKIDNKSGAQERVCLVSPDAGAYKKIFDLAKHFKISNIITANKVRNLVTGEIVSTEVPSLAKFNDEMSYVIVDDICDGGRTFVELAKVIKEQKPTAKIYLVVTHGIFSAGFDGLSMYFENIFTTNSVSDIEPGIDCALIGGKSYVQQQIII